MIDVHHRTWDGTAIRGREHGGRGCKGATPWRRWLPCRFLFVVAAEGLNGATGMSAVGGAGARRGYDWGATTCGCSMDSGYWNLGDSPGYTRDFAAHFSHRLKSFSVVPFCGIYADRFLSVKSLKTAFFFRAGSCVRDALILTNFLIKNACEDPDSSPFSKHMHGSTLERCSSLPSLVSCWEFFKKDLGLY